MSKPLYLKCVECGHEQAFVPLQPTVCQRCSSGWVDAHYDYPNFKREILRGLPSRIFNLWRYHEVLPINSLENLDLDITAGGTPMRIPRRYLIDNYQRAAIFIKDERFSTTSSFKDRQAAVSVVAMKEAGVNEAVIASTGNAAVAYAAACARAGIKLWVFMTSLVPPEKLREVALFGAEVVKVSGTYDQAKQIAAEFAKRRDLLLDRGARSLPARESMKTIAYEIVEQLGWKAPDWYIQSVSGGLGPLGVYHGFEELFSMGLIDKIPSLAVIQAEGCSPMVKAFKENKRIAEPVVPMTRIAILSTGDPGSAYSYLWDLIKKYGGIMESVEDSETFSTMRNLAKTEGLAVEPAAAVAFSGLEKMLTAGIVKEHDVVVVNCTGHTFPVEKHVLGDQWGVDFEVDESKFPIQDGLHAALEVLDEKTRSVLIVDDNPDDALLIRRFLEARKSYRVYHSINPIQGLEQAKELLPGLIVLDLTMPDMDGFTFIEELKAEARTSQIPVIVVSAKDITIADRDRLNGNIKALYQKGSLPPREFVDKVVKEIEHKTDKNMHRGES
jgi:threonine synthase